MDWFGAVAVYGILIYLARTGNTDLFGLSGDDSLHFTRQLRERIRRSGFLAKGITCLLMVVMIPPVVISHHDIVIQSLFPLVILSGSVCLYLTTRYSWNNSLLRSWLYISGVYMVLVVEVFGRDERLAGLPLHLVSHGIFLILLVLVGVKVLIRNRIKNLMVSPFDYLIMLIVLSVPLLPPSISSPYHLLTVAAKSVILFVGFKLVLMRQIQRDRNIMLAVIASALVLVLRGVLG